LSGSLTEVFEIGPVTFRKIATRPKRFFCHKPNTKIPYFSLFQGPLPSAFLVFDSKRVKKLLNLPKSAEINMIIGCGKAAPGGVYGPRFRVPMEEVVVMH
jgi:hypothetical protein